MAATIFFTVKELSAYINVKAKTIYSWAARDVIPFYQLQGVLRFKKEEIDLWLAERRSKTRDMVIDRIDAIKNALGR